MDWTILCVIYIAVPTLVSSQKYDLRNMGLEEIPDGIPNDTTKLILYKNNLGNADFSRLSGLAIELLGLTDNKLTSFPNLDAIGSTLESLDFTANLMSNISASSLEGLINLESLCLRLNQFTVFPNLSPVGDTLTYLNFQLNDLRVITAADVEPLIVLESLQLDQNEVLVIEDLSPLSATLISLTASQCDLAVTSSVTNMLSGFTKLEIVWLNKRSLTSLPDFSSCNALQVFTANNNDLHYIDPSHFDRCTALKQLDLGDNNLTTLPNITAMGNSLEILYFPRNRISHFNQDFLRAQTALVNVKFQDNALSEFPDVSMSGATLNRLVLDTNLILMIDSDVLGKLINLATLDMENNQLTSFPDVPLPKLATLDLTETCSQQFKLLWFPQPQHFAAG